MNKLFKQYLNGICKAKDMKLLLHYFREEAYSAQLEKLIQQEFSKQETRPLPDFLSNMLTKNRRIILEKIRLPSRPYRNNSFLRISIAASLIMLFSWSLNIQKNGISLPVSVVTTADQDSLSRSTINLNEVLNPSTFPWNEKTSLQLIHANNPL
jgi:hypothetical protein